ncbi:hypothetical protein HWD35_10220 [Tsukamurella tyrosinosolvens]|uniref:hypothetical protein n=1 Tax=Tsukamurella tyrosinosolvens TaxID=57704 RepID=UPI001CE20976|nr:hypothetical protein [Tsukamurella tyrosinosolvens]MCA4995086.1 hypothetical protein [Tsukamurella tyrosinosolvens]
MNPNEISRLNQNNAVFNMPTAPPTKRGFLAKPDPVATRLYEIEVEKAVEGFGIVMENKVEQLRTASRADDFDTMQRNTVDQYRYAYNESADDPELAAMIMDSVRVNHQLNQSLYVQKHMPAQRLWRT